jgi:hypothetical protein
MLKPFPLTKFFRRTLPVLLAAATLAAMFAGMLAVLRTNKTGSTPSDSARAARLAGFPKIILWAWERPEQLDFIDTRRVGVAFLARTLQLSAERVHVRPRLQPLRVPPQTSLLAVVRIESDRHEPPRLTDAQRVRAVEAIAELAARDGVGAIQIDFDATVSERDFYRQLLFDLRGRMPGAMPLSITALASWCTRDDWLTGLPVEEAVPMLFRMGADERQIRLHMAAGGGFASPVCRSSVGISTDEPFTFESSRPARTYIFHPRSWTPAAVRPVLENDKHEHTAS